MTSVAKHMLYKLDILIFRQGRSGQAYIYTLIHTSLFTTSKLYPVLQLYFVNMAPVIMMLSEHAERYGGNVNVLDVEVHNIHNDIYCYKVKLEDLT